MRTLPVSQKNMNEALSILRMGGVIAHATETCYGLACDLCNPAAVEKLFRIKKRPATQPVSALFSSVEEAKKYVQWTESAENLAKKHLPGPLTIIVSLRSDAPHMLLPTPNGGATVGVRVSSHALAGELVKNYGSPLSTTSANIHGLPNPYSAEDIEQQFAGAEEAPDVILDSGILQKTPPSTVVNLTVPGSLSTLRKGNTTV